MGSTIGRLGVPLTEENNRMTGIGFPYDAAFRLSTRNPSGVTWREPLAADQ